MEIGEALIQGCSDVHITEEFASFLTSHLMQLLLEKCSKGNRH